MNYSELPIAYRVISGVEIMPISVPAVSPIDLAIASPGNYHPDLNDLYGPIGFPKLSFILSTIPPESTIRSFSFGSSGF